MHAQTILAEITRYAVSQAWSDYDLRLDDDSSTVDRYEFNEAAHPRFAAGSPNSVGGEFRPTGANGGGRGGAANPGMSSRFNTGLQSQASQPQASQSQQPQQPRTSKKRELADRPDIQKGHKLHLGQLPDELKAKVYDWDARMGQLLAPMYYAQSQVSPDKQEEALEQSWARVDKNQVRSMLAEMNKMDFDAQSHGIPLSDFINANGVIPKMLGERLDGGARFFDPEKLRGKLGGGPQSNEPSPSTKKWLDSQSKPDAQAPSPEAAAITKQFSEASRTARSKMLANPSMREAIEAAMGIKNPGGVVDPNLGRPQAEPKSEKSAKESKLEESKPTRSLKHLPEANRALRALGYKPSDAGALLRKVLAAGTPFSNADELVTAAMSSSAGSQSARARDDGLSSVGTNKLESAIANAVGGDDLDKKNYFKSVALDAWKQMKADAEDHNDALRQIAGHFGKSLGTLASNLTQGVDTAKIKGFDQLIDHAVREYPQIVSRLMGESSSGSPEDALADAISEGIRSVPQPWDDEVIDRAAGLVGPGFFEDAPTDQQTAASDEPWDGVPFSVRSDIVHWVQRYWYLDDIERYCQVEASIERYAGKSQLAFNWDESQHPRQPAGTGKGGEFAKRELKPGYIEQPRAKAGGEVSSVDGKFYKGGALMPVHGLFSGMEKPVPKPKKADGESLTVKADQDKGPRQVRERSKDEIQADRERMENQRKWDELRSGPVGDLFWTGDRIGKFGYDVKKKMVPYLQSLSNSQVEAIGNWTKGQYVEHEMKGNRPDGMTDEEARKFIEDDFDSQAEYTSRMFLTKNLQKQLPSIATAVEGLRAITELPNPVPRLQELQSLLSVKEKYSCRSNPMHAAKPTEAQKSAGNYRMAHINVHGLDITIETPKGRARREGWPKMKAHYGYFKNTRGRDGDHVDVFVGPDRSSEMVYVIDQSSLGGKFDEHKCLIGFTSKESAIAAYRDSYKIGWIVGKVTPMTIDQFKAWLKGGNQNKPIAGQVSRYSKTAIAT